MMVEVYCFMQTVVETMEVGELSDHNGTAIMIG